MMHQAGGGRGEKGGMTGIERHQQHQRTPLSKQHATVASKTTSESRVGTESRFNDHSSLCYLAAGTQAREDTPIPRHSSGPKRLYRGCCRDLGLLRSTCSIRGTSIKWCQNEDRSTRNQRISLISFIVQGRHLYVPDKIIRVDAALRRHVWYATCRSDPAVKTCYSDLMYGAEVHWPHDQHGSHPLLSTAVFPRPQSGGKRLLEQASKPIICTLAEQL